MSQKKEYERIMVPSIHDIPGVQAKAAFLIDSGSVFREQKIDAIKLDEKNYFMPWEGTIVCPITLWS